MNWQQSAIMYKKDVWPRMGIPEGIYKARILIFVDDPILGKNLKVFMNDIGRIVSLI
jgi:hypothetical protein